MPAKHCARGEVREGLPSYSDVGEQHELLHERVRIERLLDLDVNGVVRFIQSGESHLEKRARLTEPCVSVMRTVHPMNRDVHHVNTSVHIM